MAQFPHKFKSKVNRFWDVPVTTSKVDKNQPSAISKINVRFYVFFRSGSFVNM